MVPRNNLRNGPLVRAAKRSLKTGNAQYVLIWIPEESKNTLVNLLEKAYCARYTHKNANNPITDWYFKTVNRLHSVYYGSHNLNISAKALVEKKIILLVDKAFESGNFEEITTVIPDTPTGEMRQRFNDVMKKRNFSVEDIAAGRLYVSALTDYIAFVNNFRSGSFRDVLK
jgi:hypothetical protein